MVAELVQEFFGGCGIEVREVHPITLECVLIDHKPVEGKITFDPGDAGSVAEAKRIVEQIHFPPPCRTQCASACPFEIFDQVTQRFLRTFGKSPLDAY